MTDVSFLAGTHLMESFAHVKGRVAAPNQMNFRKSAKGGRWAIFNPKIYVADFGNFKQGFLSMKLTQKE